MNTLTQRAPAHARSTRYPWKILTAAAAAAVLVVAASLGLWYARTGGTQPLSAFSVLGQAAYAMANLQTLHIKATMRTHPGENFEFIDLNAEPLPIELWRESGDPGRWRIENPGRVVAMDGQRAVLWIPKSKMTAEGGPQAGFVEWFGLLLDTDTLLEREIASAKEEGSSLSLTREAGPNSAEELVVRIAARAKGDFSQSDYLRDTSISSSDNLRIYRFDPETKRLAGLQIYVHQPQGDVLVFETQSVVYDEPIDDSLFALSIPEDAVRSIEPQAAAHVPEAATPEEAARGFFEACAAEDWPRAAHYMAQTSVPQNLQSFLGGLKLVSLGKPFQSGLYSGWFVPYEIQLKSGGTRKMNLAVRNDNPAKQYIISGGL